MLPSRTERWSQHASWAFTAEFRLNLDQQPLFILKADNILKKTVLCGRNSTEGKNICYFLTGGLSQRQNYFLSPWTVMVWPKPYTASMDKLTTESLGKGCGWNLKCPSTSSCFKCLFLSWCHYFWWFWKFDGELLWKLPLAPGLPFSQLLSPDMWADHRKLSQPWTEMSFQDVLKS